MENNELQKLWKNVDSEINQKSKDELNLLLTSKTKQTINKFVVKIIFSIIVSVSFLVFLIITTLNRVDDLIFIINNVVLVLIAITALLSGLFSWYKLQNNKFNQPIKEWLKIRIDLLSKQITGMYNKLSLYFIPLLYILIILSIHVYYENKLFIEVLKTEESIIGLIVAIPIGFFVSYFCFKKIRNIQLKDLNFLKDLYSRLCNSK